MVKKAAAQAPAPVPVEDDLPPTSSDDEEKAAQPAAAHKKKDETHLPQPSRLPAPQQQESETAPLLGSVWMRKLASGALAASSYARR